VVREVDRVGWKAPRAPWHRPAVLRRKAAAMALGVLTALTLLAAADSGYARQRTESSSPARHAGRLVAGTQEQALAVSPLSVVTAIEPGRAGYIHFFELTLADGSLETQVGIALEDGRIAWSIPNGGPSVSPFLAHGTLSAGPETLPIRHLYGIRPFADDARMEALQKDLSRRVAVFVDDRIAYCNDPENRDRFCMSCLGFVLHVVFPGPYPLSPKLPPQFRRQQDQPYYTTEDLLLYLSGIDMLPSKEARQRRVERMAIPAALKADLLELVATTDPAGRSGGLQVAAGESEAQPGGLGARSKARASTRRTGPRKL